MNQSVIHHPLQKQACNMSALNISKKRKFVADGVFYSELNEVCTFYKDKYYFFIYNIMIGSLFAIFVTAVFQTAC